MEQSIVVTLPDGSKRSVASGSTVGELAARIGPGLGKAVVAGIVDGRLADQRELLLEDCEVRILTARDPEALEVLRHSAAHLMAMAVQRIRPGTHLAFGPPVEEGFFYDFDSAEAFGEKDFAAIEEEMARIVGEDLPFERGEVSKEEAVRILADLGEDLKAEHVAELEGSTVFLYRCGDWLDLCGGPHLRSTGEVVAFKLLKTSAAYWKGDAANRSLSRIYGTAFFSRAALDEHLKLLEERKLRDHRRLGRELDLFSFHPEAPGMAFWHEKGEILYRGLLDYFEEQHRHRGYRVVRTPLVMSEELWRRSGHYDHYQEHMFFVSSEEGRLALKPMNCPGHNLIYRTRIRSYRDLPYRLTEAGIVHRNELSGVIGGLTRVRSFAIDDSHIYCTPEQLLDEILGVMDLVFTTYHDFGFPRFEMELSTRPLTGSIGTDEMWENATKALRDALQATGREFRVSPGEGAFYGPKVDFHLQDSLNRRWQCGTIQVDFAMPERFDLEYVDEDGERHRPVMIHQAIFGSLERFIAVLIEHSAGKLPLWLSPVQVVVMNITDGQMDYARQVHERLLRAGIRSRLDSRNEKIGKKIREATLEKIPTMLITGAREVGQGTVSVRDRSEGDLGSSGLDEVVDRLVARVRERG